MVAAISRHGVATLRRAVLLLGILAIMAGFLGMHVFAGAHSAHGAHALGPQSTAAQSAAAQSAVTQPPAAQAAPQPAHAHHSLERIDATVAAPEPTTHSALNPASARQKGSSPPEAPPSCLSSGGCSEMASLHSDCIPSPATASLDVPAPGAASFDLHRPAAAAAGGGSAYGYFPDSPTPADLSISRT
jgi:hypothetical protein